MASVTNELGTDLAKQTTNMTSKEFAKDLAKQATNVTPVTKEFAKDLAKQTTKIVLMAATGAADPTAAVRAAIDVGALAWRAGTYIYHKNTVQKQLDVCLEEYREAGYLAAVSATDDANYTSWSTTMKFQEAKMVLQIYPDIAQYVKEGAFTQEELKSLGLESTVTIYAEDTKSMGGDLIDRLSACCVRAGVKDMTKTDAIQRMANVSAMRIGAITLQNAFLAEGERREKGATAAVVPVLGRVLGIAAMCGIAEITLSEITMLLGRAPIFETVARSRVARLRNAHASEVFNTLLFRGNTESAAKGFGAHAVNFSGERVVVGHVKAPKKSEFLEEYASFNCELSGPPDKEHAVGTQIYMMAGWANLIKQRQTFEKQHGAFAQMMHLHAPLKSWDCHGNAYMSAGKMGKIVFKVKKLPDGTLMAKPRNFGTFDYKSGANYNGGKNRTKASGSDKMFGGIVGAPICGCRGVADISKSELTKKWKLGSVIEITSRDYVGNTIAHTQDLSTKKLAILWRPGDWIMGCFLAQILPQSSYLQGRGECLYCAVEKAALYGCAEVIACGGGRVSAEALQSEMPEIQPLAESVTIPTSTSPDAVSTDLLVDEEKGQMAAVDQEAWQSSAVTSDVPSLPPRPIDTATALFDYEAQAFGDLSFKVGDVIEVVKSTQNQMEWWTGSFRGQQGRFPGNYVQMNMSRGPATPVTPSTPRLTRVLSTESNPGSPPPAYGNMSPRPPSAGFDYFAVSDTSCDKIVPLPAQRKPVGVTQRDLLIDVGQNASVANAVDTKMPDDGTREHMTELLIEL